MVGALVTPARRGLALQVLRFGAVGIGNTVTCYIVIWLMRLAFDAPVWLASGTGYAVATAQSFTLNRWWTFAGAPPAAKVAHQAAAFVGVNIVCGLIFTAANVAVHRWLSLPASTLIATGVVVPLSFVLNRWFVFKALPA
ncbi:MAG: GtrA family protein [Janthinobacterium lividum]